MARLNALCRAQLGRAGRYCDPENKTYCESQTEAIARDEAARAAANGEIADDAALQRHIAADAASCTRLCAGRKK